MTRASEKVAIPDNMSDTVVPLTTNAGMQLPLGRRVHLPGRGTTFVREVPGPPGAPTLILIHGWVASGGLNWFTVFPTLSRSFHIVAPDLRGHGRGIRTSGRFRLADCADDIAALAAVMGIDHAIVAGYSMGGPVAQLVWRRHPDLVDGLVLAATGDSFVNRTRDRVIFTSMMMAAAGLVGLAGYALRIPTTPQRHVPRITKDRRARSVQQWALGEMRRHDWRLVLDAGRSLGSYNAKPWIATIDVPTAVLVTMDDMALPAEGQLAMASRIKGATVHPVDSGHVVCATAAFAPPLLEACRSVSGRVAGRSNRPAVAGA